MGILEVLALPGAAQLDVLVLEDGFEGHFSSAIADREVNFTKAASPDPALDRVPFERPIAMPKVEFHDCFDLLKSTGILIDGVELATKPRRVQVFLSR